MTTVAKALDLLGLFDRARPYIGLSEIARLSGLNKATCHRLLGDLVAAGLLEQVGPAREYRLGPAVLRLAMLREATVPMRSAARPELERLAEATGETSHVSVLSGQRLKPLDHAYSSRHPMRVIMSDADDLPFHATASGLAVLAALPDAQGAMLLSGDLARLTPMTETDPARLAARIDLARRRGFAESLGGYQVDVHSLAVPLFGADEACAGALAVAAPGLRMTETARALIRAELGRAALTITAHWGGVPPEDFAARWRQAA